MPGPSAPSPAPLYLRLPALALSLGVAGFLVFQAGLPGCGPAPSATPAGETPASAAPQVAPSPAAQAVHPAEPAAPGEPPAPAEPAPPAEPAEPAEPVNANADDSSGLLGSDAPKNNRDNKGNKGNKGNIVMPRFFPASKAMAPLIETDSGEESLEGLIGVGHGSQPTQQAPQAQQAPQQQALNPRR